jgi:glycosyltransferase involved in cell wall biosynthesis
VKLEGFKIGEELEEEYKYCIANIIPSDYFENCPYSIIESFAYGKPVIASNIGGIPEMLDNEEKGLLIDPGNVDHLVEAIKKLYSDQELAVKKGKSARKKAEEVYNSEKFYDNLMEIYDRLVEK